MPPAYTRGMPSLDIHYSRVLSSLILVLGGLIALVSLLTSSWVTVAVGVLLTVLGALQLINPMVRITPHEVQMRNALGMTMKRYPLTSPGDLFLDGTALQHLPSGKRVAQLSFGVHQPDIVMLRQQIPSR